MLASRIKIGGTYCITLAGASVRVVVTDEARRNGRAVFYLVNADTGRRYPKPRGAGSIHPCR